MLPVLVQERWRVEDVLIDLGTGLGTWIEIRCGERLVYCKTVRERDAVLRAYGLHIDDFTAVDTIDDGCE